jgi:hypothetical protein
LRSSREKRSAQIFVRKRKETPEKSTIVQQVKTAMHAAAAVQFNARLQTALVASQKKTIRGLTASRRGT